MKDEDKDTSFPCTFNPSIDPLSDTDLSLKPWTTLEHGCSVHFDKSYGDFCALVPDPLDALQLYSHPGCFGSNFSSKGGPILSKCKGKLLEPYYLSMEEVVYLSVVLRKHFFQCKNINNSPLIFFSHLIPVDDAFSYELVDGHQLVSKMLHCLPIKGMAMLL